MRSVVAKSVAAGILLALLVIKMFYMFDSPIGYQLFALFFGFTACVYFGAALADKRLTWISVESVMSLLFLAIASLGLFHAPIWLVIGYFLHGCWDLLHHPKVIKTKVVRWFPPVCVAFDWIVAAYILAFY